MVFRHNKSSSPPKKARITPSSGAGSWPVRERMRSDHRLLPLAKATQYTTVAFANRWGTAAGGRSVLSRRRLPKSKIRQFFTSPLQNGFFSCTITAVSSFQGKNFPHISLGSG